MALSSVAQRFKSDGGRFKRLKPSPTIVQGVDGVDQGASQGASQGAGRGLGPDGDCASVPPGRSSRTFYGPLPSGEAFLAIGRLVGFLEDDGGRLTDLADRVRVTYVPPQLSLMRAVVVETEPLEGPEADRLSEALCELGLVPMGSR